MPLDGLMTPVLVVVRIGPNSERVPQDMFAEDYSSPTSMAKMTVEAGRENPTLTGEGEGGV